MVSLIYSVWINWKNVRISLLCGLCYHKWKSEASFSSILFSVQIHFQLAFLKFLFYHLLQVLLLSNCISSAEIRWIYSKHNLCTFLFKSGLQRQWKHNNDRLVYQLILLPFYYIFTFFITRVIQWISWIFSKKLAIGSTVYSCIFFKKINWNEFFCVPKDSQHDLLYWRLHLKCFFTGESMCFHCMDCLFDSGSKWQTHV